jgi:phosphate uptake regulator
MDFRRLIGFGKSSYVVSVPKAWAAEHHLTKGDILVLQRVGTDILISPDRPGKTEPKRITLQADNKPLALLETEIVAAYLCNYALIEIKGASLKTHGPDIKRMLHDLSGLELIEQTATNLVAKDLLDLQEISTDTLIRRTDLILRSMHEDATGRYHDDYSESIINRDADVNRLVFLTKRVIRAAFHEPSIAKTLNATPADLLRAWTLTTILEHIGDTTKRIARTHRATAQKPHKPSRDIHGTLCTAYNDALKAYHTKNPALASAVECQTTARAQLIDAAFPKRAATTERLATLYHQFNTHISDAARSVLL